MVTSSDFVPFDPSGPLLLEERLRAVPSGSAIKGLFFQSILNEVRRVSPESFSRVEYSSLKDYPTSEFLRLLVDSAAILYPTLPPREAIRRLGRLHYKYFVGQSVGRVLMSFAGGFMEAALGITPRAYELAGKGARATVRELTAFSALVSLEGCWDFPECHQVGVFEGVLEAFQMEGNVWVKPRSFSAVELAIFWKRKKSSKS